VGETAARLGFTHVSLSSEVMPMVRIVPRGFTASADAYLTPCIKNYLEGFASGFKDNLAGTNVLFMQSDGGLTPMQSFNGSRAILSGPAGGVVGYAMTSYSAEGSSDDGISSAKSQPVIGFDMGGTSTDVSRYAGAYEHVFESTTAGVTIQAPQLDVNTVAAGGGSMLFFRSGLFVVGPESASAHPGPVCYRKGGPLAITDANLCLGRILPDYFPKIFGESEDQPLDREATLAAFDQLTLEVNRFNGGEGGGGKPPMSMEEVAMGYIAVANEAMCRPIRALTQGKGYDTSRHALACFGGAGGQHACAIARSLGMSTVIVHKYAGILSAFGMALADVVHEEQEPTALRYGSPEAAAEIAQRVAELREKCVANLAAQGFAPKQISTEAFLHMRYEGTDCALMCSSGGAGGEGNNYLDTFLDRYQTEFGFTLPSRTILVDDVRVRGTGQSGVQLNEMKERATGPPSPDRTARVYFEGGWQDTPVFLMEAGLEKTRVFKKNHPSGFFFFFFFFIHLPRRVFLGFFQFQEYF
jgi:5-oxoprolinase (ATP-hydrolysing)